jgi:hypothetical protein
MKRFSYPGVPRDQARRMKRIFKADDDTDDEELRVGLQYLNTKRGAALVRRLFPRGISNPQDLEQLARLVVRALGDDALRPAPKEWQSWPDADNTDDAARVAETEKGFRMQDRADVLEAVVKRHGSFTGLCKSIAAGRSRGISERELSLCATGFAMNRFPELTPEQAFAKAYGDARSSGEARAFWDATETLKQAAFTSDHVDDEDEEDDDEENGQEIDALGELHAKAVALRKRMPHLSEAQAFTKAYEQNSELAKRERRQNGF